MGIELTNDVVDSRRHRTTVLLIDNQTARTTRSRARVRRRGGVQRDTARRPGDMYFKCFIVRTLTLRPRILRLRLLLLLPLCQLTGGFALADTFGRIFGRGLIELLAKKRDNRLCLLSSQAQVGCARRRWRLGHRDVHNLSAAPARTRAPISHFWSNPTRVIENTFFSFFAAPVVFRLARRNFIFMASQTRSKKTRFASREKTT